jgi:ComF family protein
MIRPLGPKDQEYDWVAVPFAYAGILRDMILRAKFQPDESAGRLLARYLQDTFKQGVFSHGILDAPFDVVTYVPSHWRRRFRRGYEFPALLAFGVSKSLNISMAHLLDCVRLEAHLSAAQSSLERQSMLGQRFKARRAALQKSRILLVDDVVTTGSTLKEAAQELKALGHEVHCFAFAQTLSKTTSQRSTVRLPTASLNK